MIYCQMLQSYYVLFAFVHPPQAQSSQKLEDWPVLFMKLGFAGISRFTSINICTRTCTLCSIIIISYIYNYIILYTYNITFTQKDIHCIYVFKRCSIWSVFSANTSPFHGVPGVQTAPAALATATLAGDENRETIVVEVANTLSDNWIYWS